MVLPPAQLPSTFFPMMQAEEVLGKQVCYKESRSGESKQYTITDKIINYLRGTYYLITDSEGMKVEVSEGEMLDLLSSV
jgi:hypothetical protein